MPIDSNILPYRGEYRGLSYSRRYQDIVPLSSQSGFVTQNPETGRYSWYMGNAYTSYVGGDGLLNSSWENVVVAANTISVSPATEYHPVNISLAVMDTSGGVRSGSIRSTGGGSTYIPQYSCPVIDFDASKICIAARVLIANIGGSDPESESWTTTEVDLKTVMTDPVYNGIMENGYTEDGKFLTGIRPLFYTGNNGERTYNDRVSVVVENSPTTPASWNYPENMYFFFNNATAQTFKRMTDYFSSSNTDYSQGMNRPRKYDSVANMTIDGNGGAIGNIGNYTINCDNFSNGYRIIEGTNYVYKKGRYAYKDYAYFGRFYTGEQVLRTLAATGLYFAIDSAKAASALIGSLTFDNDIYIGKLNSSGNTTGDYVHGTAAANVPQASWTHVIDDAETGGFVPSDPTGKIPEGEDPNTYDEANATVLPTPVYTAGNKIYAVNVGELGAVLDVISVEAAALETELETVQKFLTNNPIDAIAGALYYPFDVSSIITTELTQTEIILGNISTGVNGYKVTNRVGVYNMGKCTYYTPDGLDDFRSYEPYSSAELYVPYCGSVKISPADYIGHEISVKYLIDIESGGCVALIYRDALAIDSIAGQIGVRIPISGVQTATLAAAQEQSQRNSINAKVATAAAIVGVGAAVFTAGSSLALTAAAVGGATALSAAATRLDSTQYDLEHQQIPYKTVGSAGAATSTCNEQSVRLVIHRPVMLDNYDAQIYGRTKGFACLITNTLSAVSGFTQVSNADLSGIPATEREKELILEALKDGTII